MRVAQHCTAIEVNGTLGKWVVKGKPETRRFRWLVRRFTRVGGKGERTDAAIHASGLEKRNKRCRYSQGWERKRKRDMVHFTQVGRKSERRDVALYAGWWERRKQRCGTCCRWLGNEEQEMQRYTRTCENAKMRNLALLAGRWESRQQRCST